VTDYRRGEPKGGGYSLRGPEWGDDHLVVSRCRQSRKLVAQLKPDEVHGPDVGWYGDVAVQCSSTKRGYWPTAPRSGAPTSCSPIAAAACRASLLLAATSS